MKRKLVAIALAGAFTAIAPVAAGTQGREAAGHPVHGAADAAAVQGVGTVRKVDAAQGKVTLQHEPIERLGWPAMTMAFRVRDAKLLDGLEPGRKVRFAFVQQGPAYVITAIE
jgi:Cu(I)/Ag(I) efflux system protein CusF